MSDSDRTASSRSSGPTATSSATTASRYQDYLEQLTFLLFLKMADERAAAHRRGAAHPRRATAGPTSPRPQMEGVKLEQHYRETLQRRSASRAACSA